MSDRDPIPEDAVDRRLLECLDAPEGARLERLERICSAEPAIATELRRRFDRLLELGMLPDPERVDATAVPRRLGHYRLLRRLGGGGMGVVYEAFDESLGRRVALKLIRSDQMAFVDSRRRFEREVRAAGRLDHPNLCPIYEAGEVDGVPFIAMRYVEGRSLAAWIREQREAGSAAGSLRGGARSRLGLDAVLVVEKVARGLHAAHEAGVVHRDVKPANVLIDEEGEPALVDFGLARDADAPAAGLTSTGDRIGTPAYMAPEQVSGSGEADRRTDVYGLGATLYECLTLRCPFDSSAREELYHRILTEQPRDPRAYDRSIGGELSVVIGKALEKDPIRRFASAEELADDLRRIREHQPIRSRRPGLPIRVIRWAQRNRAAAGVLAATFVGLVVSLWFLRASKHSESRFRAFAWLQAAGAVEAGDPELAFKCAREALRLDDDPVILARVQETMFGMRDSKAVPADGLDVAEFSPDDRFLFGFSSRGGGTASLFRREGDGWRETPLPADGFTYAQSFVPFAFSPDGNELAVWSDSSSIHRYRLDGAEPRVRDVLRCDSEGTGGFRACARLAYSPDTARLLSCHVDRTILWSRAGERLHVLEGVSWHAAEFLPGERVAANGSLWSLEGERLASLPVPRMVRFVLVGRDRFFVVSTRYIQGERDRPTDRRIHAFDLDGRPLDGGGQPPWRDPRDDLRYAEIDPTGTRLLLVLRDGRVRQLEAATLELLNEWRVPAATWGAPARYSPDGSRIASGFDTIQIRTALDARVLDEVRGLHGNLWWLDWSSSGEVVAGTSGGTTRVWSLEMSDGVPGFAGHGSPDVDVSPSGDLFAFTSDRGVVRLCGADGELVEERPFGSSPAHLRFTSNEELVLAAEGAREFFVWQPAAIARGAPMHRLETPFALEEHPPVRLGPDRWLLWGDYRQILLWTAGEEELRPLHERAFPTLTRTFAVSPDRTRVLTGGWDTLRLGTIEGEDLWCSSEGETVNAPSFAFAPDGRHALTASNDANAYLWDLEGGGEAGAVFRGHQSALNGAAFSTDGRLVATSSVDGSIRVWDCISRRTLLRFRHHGVTRIAFTARGQLVSGGKDGTVRRWSLERDAVRRLVDELDVPEMMEAERDQVGHLLD